jgi:hypothetical protein
MAEFSSTCGCVPLLSFHMRIEDAVNIEVSSVVSGNRKATFLFEVLLQNLKGNRYERSVNPQYVG